MKSWPKSRSPLCVTSGQQAQDMVVQREVPPNISLKKLGFINKVLMAEALLTHEASIFR
jgi:hypothetical protein